jgi:hypothetical protein
MFLETAHRETGWFTQHTPPDRHSNISSSLSSTSTSHTAASTAVPLVVGGMSMIGEGRSIGLVKVIAEAGAILTINIAAMSKASVTNTIKRLIKLPP